MNTNDLLKELCEVNCPSGMEEWIYPVIKDNFKRFGSVSTGNLNNIYIHQSGKNKGKVMIMAHADEVFLMVTGFEKNGFLKFSSIGIDAKTLISQEVTIHGRSEIEGIIGIKPPHIMSKEERESAPTSEALLIDTGFSEESIKKIVKIGDYVTLKRRYYNLLNNNAACKAVDDRAGIASMYVCASELEKTMHNTDVYFVCSCQEEVGHRGARSACYDIKPDIGIAVDVTFDSGTMGDSERENKLGCGPVICVGPNVHPKLRKAIIDCAKEHGIPYQIEVEPGNTGTDAWDIQVAGNGVPSLLISIPIKYMHTSVEVVNIADIENTGKLLAEFIKALDNIELEELLCY